MELTLGPVLFDWPRDKLLDFYKEAAEMAVDTVYIGEVACQRRRGLSVDDIAEMARMLTGAGKKVFLSTLAVVSTEEELEFIRSLATLDLPIEANDSSTLAIASEKGVELSAGPHILTYNPGDIEFLKSCGVSRVTFPVELPKESVAHNIKETGISGEVFSHGKVPLAFSWRCYSSRANGRAKSECVFDCRKDPEGMTLRSMDDEALFTINGTSILSASTYSLVSYVEELGDLGVSALRVSPRFEGTEKIVDIFRARINGKLSAEEGLAEIKKINNDEDICNGWYSGLAGKDILLPEGLLDNDGPRPSNNIIEMPLQAKQ